jgi:hypothetical protein
MVCRSQKDFVYHSWQGVAWLVKTQTNFEEEQSRTEPAVHGIYCAPIESV